MKSLNPRAYNKLSVSLIKAFVLCLFCALLGGKSAVQGLSVELRAYTARLQSSAMGLPDSAGGEPAFFRAKPQANPPSADKGLSSSPESSQIASKPKANPPSADGSSQASSKTPAREPRAKPTAEGSPLQSSAMGLPDSAGREPAFFRAKPKKANLPSSNEELSSSDESSQASSKAPIDQAAPSLDSLLPDEIPIPSRFRKRSAGQIKALFASLKKQYGRKKANLWFLNYRQALLLKKKDKSSFCALMKELSGHTDFPLKDLALISAYELCPFDEALAFEPERFPAYLRSALAQAFYKRRKRFEDDAQTLKALIYLARHSAYKELRVSYIKQALFYAPKQSPSADMLNQLLYKEAPRFKPNPGPKDWLARAEDLRQNRSWKKAISFYIKVLNSPQTGFEEKDLSFKALGQIYKIQKNRKKRAENSRLRAKWLLKENTQQSLRQYYKIQLQRARQKWNRDKNEEAVSLLSSLLGETQEPEISAQALYLRGLIYEQELKAPQALDDWDQALKHFKKMKGKKGLSPLKEKILWKKAWALKAEGNYRSALIHLGFLIKTCQNPYTRYKALFWRGKILFDIGQRTLAKRALLKAAEQDYFGYYGLMARRIMKQKPVFEPVAKSPLKLHSSKSLQETALIHWLSLMKKSDLLAQFLDERKSLFFKQKNPTQQEWLSLILLWTKSKKYLDIFQSVEKMDPQTKAVFFKRHSALLFPLEFSEKTIQTAEKYNVPTAFVFAIMRQESAFNPRARSLADAFGLLQLIPSTARRTAKAFKISYKNYKALYQPQKNIILGTAHLKQLLNLYDGSFIFTAAAYNAGAQPVKKWTKNLKNFKSLEFIENIPYEETRSYVKLIIRNYVFYHNQLSGGEGEDWFPDFILR